MSGQTCLLVAVILAASACAKKDVGRDSSVRLAMVGQEAITESDLRARLAEQPAFALARYKTIERKKELLDTIIRQELLLQEAHRRGLDSDPEVRATVEKVLIQRLSRVYAEENDKAHPLPEADLRRYYDQHRMEFVSLTRARVSHLFLATPEKDTRRARAAAEAAKLLQQIKEREAKGEKQALELTASQRSEDAATKATGGDLGYRTREELTAAWGAAFADAVMGLKTPKEIGGVIATDKGIHLIKLLGRQEGYETPFESARSRIQGRLVVERRSHSIDELVVELRKTTKVEIDEKALGKVEVESSSPTAAASR
jgi:peptidyl-prolyl cis-trans isomerase C